MTSPDATRMLDDRYGRVPSRGRRAWWIGVGTVAVLVVGYFSWATVARNLDAVDFDTTGYHWHDEHSITVDFQATLRAGSPLACAIEAQDVEHGVVGWRVIEYPADPAHTRRFSETIPTVASATTGLVASCWIP